MSVSIRATSRFAAAAACFPIGQIDWCSVFGSSFRDGNRTAVLRLGTWPSDDAMLSIAEFLQMPETSFFTIDDSGLELRWFSRHTEVPMCGHGAIAVAASLSPMLEEKTLIEVRNHAGRLWLTSWDSQPAIVLPRMRLRPLAVEAISIGAPVRQLFDAGRDYLAVLEDEASLVEYVPDSASLARLDKIGLIAASSSTDGTVAFRFFAPSAGVLEDTASASVMPSLVAWSHLVGLDGTAFMQRPAGRAPVALGAVPYDNKVIVPGTVIAVASGALNDGVSHGVL